MVIAGNTAMHHLFAGLGLERLAVHPFESESLGLQRWLAAQLGWNVASDPEVVFLPCIGGFVGSDILAGVLATGLDRAGALSMLVDLGTNGEVVVADGARLLACSVAAGPAFEGARISCGMRAAPGAIASVAAGPNGLDCRVLEGGKARGICGSGLVDAVAAALDIGELDSGGRCRGRGIELRDGIRLTQSDVRELQLAKAAVGAAIELLLEHAGRKVEDVERVFLAGAFGHYVNPLSALRIGLLPFEPSRVQAVGNSSLRGARLALELDDLDFGQLRGRIEHVHLERHPGFQDRLVEHLALGPTRRAATASVAS